MKSTKTIEKYLVKEKRNKKIIMVTHDLFQAKRLADEIIFINEGKIIETSPKKRFLNKKDSHVWAQQLLSFLSDRASKEYLEVIAYYYVGV